MAQEDVKQIKADGYTVGIMGLNAALEELAPTLGGKPDSEVTETLLNRLSKKNYIPAKAHASYGKAFLREFKKFTGENRMKKRSSPVLTSRCWGRDALSVTGWSGN